MNPGFKKKGKRGRRSRGIILYFKKKLAENKTGTKVHSTKNFVWIKLDKALCGISHDIYIRCLYSKPRMRVNCPENDDLFDQLLYSINKYSQLGKKLS